MEEYTEVVKFVNGERKVFAHAGKTGQIKHMCDILEDFELNGRKPYHYAPIVSPPLDGVCYLMCMTIFFKKGEPRSQTIHYMSDEDFREMCLYIENRNARRRAAMYGMTVEVAREADLSKLSFLNGREPVVSNWFNQKSV